jgi:hypothetical protein
MPIRWFLNLPAHRKVLLFLAGGMLTLVFDAFIDHFKWARFHEQGLLHGMQWNQWIPIVYGLIAAAALGVPALLQLEDKRETQVLKAMGILGLVTGTLGVYFHLARIVSELPDQKTIESIGRALKDEPPIFAPAAFAGVGLLLLTIKRLTGAQRKS